MSEETEGEVERKHGKKKKGEGPPPEERNDGTIHPDDPELTRWIAARFEDGEHPSRLVVCQIFGRGSRQGTGYQICTHVWNPSKTYHQETFVKLANEFRGAAQSDVAGQGIPKQRYIVIAYDATKSSKEIATYQFTVEREMGAMSLLPRNGAIQAVEDEEEEAETKESRAQAMAFDYTRMGIEGLQWGQQRIDHAYGGTMQIMDSMIRDLRAENARLRAEIQSNFDLLRKALLDKDDAESRKLERQLAYDEHKLWVDIKRDGFATVRGMLPNVVAHATDGKVQIPGGQANEVLTLKAFADRVREKGLSDTIFGEWQAGGVGAVCTKPGIFTPPQTVIILDVIGGERTVDALKDVLPDLGGQHEISMDQVQAVMSVPGISMEMVMPLKAMFDRLKEKFTNGAAGAAKG